MMHDTYSESKLRLYMDLTCIILISYFHRKFPCSRLGIGTVLPLPVVEVGDRFVRCGTRCHRHCRIVTQLQQIDEAFKSKMIPLMY